MKWLGILFVLMFLLPTAATTAWWYVKQRPSSWSTANWSSSGVLPPPEQGKSAIYLMAARTGGLKGAISVHSWIVLKPAAADSYDRYDMVGWGMPVRENNYPADGSWYSNRPFIVHSVHGQEAEDLIPRFRQAITRFPFAARGDYRVWPGPNSNSFTAYVLDQIPEFGAVLPSNAIGRDFAPGIGSLRWSSRALDLRGTLHGLAGFAIGLRSGIEVQFAGLVAGVDFARPALKIPAFGRLDLMPESAAEEP